MTRLILTRHGQTDWNAARKFQGQTDTNLNETGLKQADALAVRLSAQKLDAIYASDLSRTRQTAAAVNRFHGLDIGAADRLREMSFGKWEGLTYEEMCARDARVAQSWTNFMIQSGAPGGESIPVFAARVRTFLDEIAAQHADQTVLLVVHGGVIRMILCALLDFPLEKYWQFKIDQTSLTEIETYPDGGILNYLNDTSHLRRVVDG